MQLVQISILIFGVFFQNEYEYIYITFCLLSCLYLAYLKRYKSMYLVALIYLITSLYHVNLMTGKNYTAGDVFNFSALITLSPDDSASVTAYDIESFLPQKVLLDLTSLFASNHLPLKGDSNVEVKVYGQAKIKKVLISDRKGDWLQKQLHRQNLDAKLWLTDINIVQLQKIRSLSGWRKKTISYLGSMYSSLPSWRFNQSLLLGDKSLLTSKDIWQSRFLGLSHLFVVSGLHVGFVYLLLMRCIGIIWRFLPSFLIQVIGDKHRLYWFLGMPNVLCYCFITGWGEPVQRAAIMLFVWQTAKLVQVNCSPLTILSFAFLIVGLVTPSSILSPSLWLSFCLVFLIMLYINNHESTWKSWLKIQFMLTLGATVLTLGWQESISTMNVLVNLVIVPFTAVFWFPLAFFSVLETLIIGTTKLMTVLDSVLSYVFYSLDFIALNTISIKLDNVMPFIFKPIVYLLIVAWVLYERATRLSYVLLLLVSIFTLSTSALSWWRLNSNLIDAIWWVENKTNSLHLLNEQKETVINTYWANSITETNQYWLHNLLNDRAHNSAFNTHALLPKLIESKVLIWPFVINKIEPKLMKALSPNWLLLKEVPNKRVEALLSALHIKWLVLTKKQSIKIEFWQGSWYIKHSNCLLPIKLLQEKQCERVSQLENMLN